MAAQQQTQPRPKRDTVDFPPNVAVTLSLQYGEGKIVAGQFGERVMYSTTDGRVMFLDPDVAAQIVNLGINVRESFTITKQWDGVKGSPVAWSVARVPGEQPNGTFVAPRTPEPPAAPKPMQRASSPSGHEALIAEANALVDAYAEVLHRALTTHQGRVKPDEVRALMVTAYIQRRQLSSVA